MTERKRSKAPREFWRIAASIILVGGFGVLLVWGFIAGRGEAALEAQREKPVKAGIQVSHDGAGVPIITLSSDLEERSAIVAELPGISTISAAVAGLR